MLSDYIVFWLVRPLAEFAFVVIGGVGIGVIIFLASVPRTIRQRRCKHTQVFETQACDAICVSCGRNLGFIQEWRDKQPKEKTPC